MGRAGSNSDETTGQHLVRTQHSTQNTFGNAIVLALSVQALGQWRGIKGTTISMCYGKAGQAGRGLMGKLCYGPAKNAGRREFPAMRAAFARRIALRRGRSVL
jgi:hypothetical protein